MVNRHEFWNKYYVADENAPVQSKWLFTVMNRSHTNMTGLADKLHMSRQNISALINRRSGISFVVIVAICYLCDIDDDPEQVWKAIKEDRKEKLE